MEMFIIDRKRNLVCSMNKKHVHAPREASFWCAESFKSHRWLEKSASQSLWSHGKHQCFPLLFLITGQPTYHVVGQPKWCVCACAYVMHECVHKYSLMGRRVHWSVKVAKGRGFSEQIVAPGNSQTVPVLVYICGRLPPIEVEFIDQPCGFKSTEFDLGLIAFCSLNYHSKTCCPSLHGATLIPSVQQNR